MVMALDIWSVLPSLSFFIGKKENEMAELEKILELYLLTS